MASATTTNTEKKIKFLVCGPVLGKLNELGKKLKTLQGSKAGPFDMCLCVGPFLSGGEENDESSIMESLKSIDFVIPVYTLELGIDLSKIIENKDESTSSPVVVPIGKNIYYLRGGGETMGCADIAKLPLNNEEGLDVAWMPSFARIGDETTSSLENKVREKDYKGCDVLLTSEWGQGLANSSAIKAEYQKVIQEEHSMDIHEIGGYDVSKIATLTKPRYHFAPGLSTCSYRHMASSPFLTSPESPPCRFIALSKVSTVKDPKFKFLHAINLAPLRNSETTEQSDNSLLTPYTSITEEIVKQPIPNFEPDQNACLFLHGFAKDRSNNIMGGDLLQAFQQFGCIKIQMLPQGRPSYAFLTFQSHNLAMDCLNILQGQIIINGLALSLKWRTPKREAPPQDQQISKKRKTITEAEASESTQLYIRLPSNDTEKPFQESFEEVRNLLQITLEKAINEGNEEDEKVTAENEPALVVDLRLTSKIDSYAFCAFASHAAASMAIATLTRSIDGGVIDETYVSEKTHLIGTMLYWANASNTDISNAKPTIDSCWFCLSNPNIIQHLIISKHEHCYITIPRGPVTTYHSLIVPNEHHPKGLFTLPNETISPILSMKQILQNYYATNTKLNHSVFIYERAFVPRRGLHHSHFQCIPIPNQFVSQLDIVIQKMASQLGFGFEPTTDDELIQRELTSYFYIDLPFFTGERLNYKQIIYVPNEDSTLRPPPLQFGREIISSLLGRPELSNWKACVMEEEKEKEIADEYRGMIAGVFDE